MHPGYAVFYGVNAVLKLGKHTASQHSAVHKILGLLHRHLGDKGGLILIILIHALHIREKSKLFRLHCRCNGTGRVIRIDVIAQEILIKAYGTDDGQKILFQQIIYDFGIHFLHISHKPDVLSAGVFLTAFKHHAVLAADSHRIDTQLTDQLDQALIDFIKDHLGNLHGGFVCNPESVLKLGLHSHLAYPAADLLPASVHNDGLKAYQLKKHHILYNLFLQFLIHHGASAVFYHHDFPVKTLDIRQCLNEHGRLLHWFQIHFHTPLVMST